MRKSRLQVLCLCLRLAHIERFEIQPPGEQSARSKVVREAVPVSPDLDALRFGVWEAGGFGRVGDVVEGQG